MTSDYYETTAHQIESTSFDSLDAQRIAVHKAVLEIHDEDLCSRKYVFHDASFLTVRTDRYMAVNPASGESLMSYARWIGVASSMEVTVVTCLLNLVPDSSMLVN